MPRQQMKSTVALENCSELIQADEQCRVNLPKLSFGNIDKYSWPRPSQRQNHFWAGVKASMNELR